MHKLDFNIHNKIRVLKFRLLKVLVFFQYLNQKLTSFETTDYLILTYLSLGVILHVSFKVSNLFNTI